MVQKALHTVNNLMLTSAFWDRGYYFSQLVLQLRITFLGVSGVQILTQVSSAALMPLFLSSLVVKVFWAVCPRLPTSSHSDCNAELKKKKFIAILIYNVALIFSSVQSLKSCPTLCHPMDWSTAVFPVHHQMPEPAQTHVHQVGNAIQMSHPLLSPSPPTFNLSQHQGLFKWVSSSHQVAKVLEFQLQH